MNNESKQELSQIGCMFAAMLWVIGMFAAGYTGYFVEYCVVSMLIAALLIIFAAMSNGKR